MKAEVTTRFDCSHVTTVKVQLDDDVVVPETVRGLGKCRDCMKDGEAKMIPITGVQPKASGALELDSIFWMPIE